VALAWVLRNPAVSSAILGVTIAAQLEQNLKALEVKLSDAEWREVETHASNQPAKPTGAPKPTAAAKAKPAAKVKPAANARPAAKAKPAPKAPRAARPRAKK
jgi:hypothetical protein